MIGTDLARLAFKSKLKPNGEQRRFFCIACHVCGYVDKENRQTQSLFKCVKCGHIDNADVNASKNIKGQDLPGLLA